LVIAFLLRELLPKVSLDSTEIRRHGRTDLPGAYGYAVDPDHPDVDVRVRILSDGVEVAQTVANVFRKTGKSTHMSRWDLWLQSISEFDLS
jgi:hypothetical protein